MKTTVNAAEGKVTVMPYEFALSDCIYISINRGEGRSEAVSLDQHAAHVLGTALVQLAEQAEAAR